MTARENKLELLETRRLLTSAVVVDSELQLRGDNNVKNVIFVGLRPDEKSVSVTINGGPQLFFNTKDFDLVRMIGGNLADVLVVDQLRRSFPITAIIVGNAGNDTIYGGDGPDLLVGDDGNDFIRTFAGNDTVLAGNGNDNVFCGDDSKLVFGDAGNDGIYGGTGDNRLFGNDGNDFIVAGSKRTEMYGDAGNDTLKGQSRDTLYGGGGADVLFGGSEQHFGEIPKVDKLMKVLRPKDPTELLA